MSTIEGPIASPPPNGEGQALEGGGPSTLGFADALSMLDVPVAATFPSGEAAVVDGDGYRTPAVVRLRPRVALLRTAVDLFESGDEVLGYLKERPLLGTRQLCYVNAHSLNLAYSDARYQDVLDRADLVLNDGIGVQLAARMQGVSFPENLNGSDFTLRVLELAAGQRWKVYLYGGHPGVAEAARDRLTDAIAGLEIVGVRHGYVDLSPEEIAADVQLSGADVLVVALGQPQQELWLDAHLSMTGCHLGLGVGAFLDFMSGRVVRAPRWMNRLGVEWVFRLVQEPRRLWSRYLVGNVRFLWRAWRCRP